MWANASGLSVSAAADQMVVGIANLRRCNSRPIPPSSKVKLKSLVVSVPLSLARAA